MTQALTMETVAIAPKYSDIALVFRDMEDNLTQRGYKTSDIKSVEIFPGLDGSFLIKFESERSASQAEVLGLQLHDSQN